MVRRWHRGCKRHYCLPNTRHKFSGNDASSTPRRRLPSWLRPIAELPIPANIRDEGAGHLVPPGKLVADRQVMLLVDLKAETENVNVNVRDIKQFKLAVRNDETFEEYLRVFPDVRTI